MNMSSTGKTETAIAITPSASDNNQGAGAVMRSSERPTNTGTRTEVGNENRRKWRQRSSRHSKTRMVQRVPKFEGETTNKNGNML